MEIESLLSLYRPCMYPLGDTVKETEVTLVDLVCQYIVQDSSVTEHVIQQIPVDLFYPLMRAALLISRDRAIEVLIARWPSPVLTLQRFAPSLFSPLNVRYSERAAVEAVRRAIKFTTCIAHTFVECLKKRTPTKLQCIDLTGYPTAEVIVNYLSSHVMLVYNEHRQREIISMYNQVTESLPNRQEYHLDSTLPDQTFMLRLDVHLESPDTHMEVCKALRTSRCHHCQFRLSIHSLDLTGLSVARISVLLEQINIQELHNLSLRYTGLGVEGLTVLSPWLSQLTHVTALDLSCNGLNVTSDGALCGALAEMFSRLSALRRLDVSNNRLKFKLRQLLQMIPSRLTYLHLSACGLSLMDLSYLRLSHHMGALVELDVSENDLSGEKFTALMEILKVCECSLQLLELEDCGLHSADVRTLWSILRRREGCLRYLNLSRNEHIVTTDIGDSLPQLVQIASLEAVKLSYPLECYISEEAREVQPIKDLFHGHVTHTIKTMCSQKNRSPVHIHLVGP